MIAFISGHLDLTKEEFEQHYVPKINKAIENGDSFVVGDARGADYIAQKYLHNYTTGNRVSVFHMFKIPRNLASTEFNIVGGFTSDNSRDKAMTISSDYDIAWVREGREKSGTARNIQRRSRVEHGNS